MAPSRCSTVNAFAFERGTLNQEIGHWQAYLSEHLTPIETVEGSVVAKLFGKESQVHLVHRQSIKDLAPISALLLLIHDQNHRSD